jgi:hypothetical protein
MAAVGAARSWRRGLVQRVGLRRGDSARGLGPVYQHARVCVSSRRWVEAGKRQRRVYSSMVLEHVGKWARVVYSTVVGSPVMLRSGASLAAKHTTCAW